MSVLHRVRAGFGSVIGSVDEGPFAGRLGRVQSGTVDDGPFADLLGNVDDGPFAGQSGRVQSGRVQSGTVDDGPFADRFDTAHDGTFAGQLGTVQSGTVDDDGLARDLGFAEEEFAAVDPGLVSVVPRADRLSFRDVLSEATTDIGTRPARLVMTIIGTVLGVGALIATIGLAQTASGQIANQFTALAATQVVVEPATARTVSGAQAATARLPWDAVTRVSHLAGVEAAVLLGEVNLGTESITTVPVNDPSLPETTPPPLFGATAELIEVTGSRIVNGRMFDAGHEARRDRVAVLGARAAERLGVTRVDTQPAIFIGETAYSVIGIFDDAARRADLLSAVIVPMETARAELGLIAAEQLVIEIAPGAGPVVGAQAPIALDPNSPEGFRVSAPAARSELAQNVRADINVVFLVLGLVVLLAGGLGIANVTSLTVMERTSEIGLRRALGATGRQIASQFVVESVIIGLLGGVIGSALGVVTVIAASVIQEWTPITDVRLAAAGAVLGALVGLLAGGIPARRAARIEPVAALRAG